VRVRLAAIGSEDITAKLPASGLPTDIAPGRDVLISWTAANCQAFAPE
jgi:hypothetical protein